MVGDSSGFRQQKMAPVEGIKRAAKQGYPHSSRLQALGSKENTPFPRAGSMERRLLTDLSGSSHDVFGSGQFPGSHGAASVQFTGGDPDFRPQAKDPAVVKTRRCIMQHGRGIHAF